MDWAVVLGENIRRLRKDRGLTQEHLAHEAGVAMRYVAGIERAEENVSLRYLVKLADALGVEPADLLTRDSEGS
jgi:transcriptional regulator with XRE-family HTH domain